MDAGLSDEARDELDALRAIYGDDAVRAAGSSVTLDVSSSDGARALDLVCTLPPAYPAAALSWEVLARRGVPHALGAALERHLEATAAQLTGMPLLFALVEAGRTFLDTGGEAVVEEDEGAVAAAEEAARPLNHQVGNPLIVTGTRCTENVFLSWRERFLEWRAVQRAQAEAQRLAETGAGLTGKQMFLAGLLKNEAAAADAAEMAAVGKGAALLESIDASLFTDDVDE